MKQVKLITIIFLMLLTNVSVKAQNSGLEGSYLKVGSGNTLIENSASSSGFAIRQPRILASLMRNTI